MSCLKVTRKFDIDLLKLSDAFWCQFFGETCLRKHLRINLKYPFIREIIRVICNDGQTLDEPDRFLSPKYWRNILDVLNSRYTLEGQSIKSMHDWKYIACCFFNYIASKPDIMNEEWLEEFSNEIENNMKRKNFRTIEDLINYIEKYDQLDISTAQECYGDSKQCSISSTSMTIEENSVSHIVNDTEQNLSATDDSEDTQISEELLDEKENRESSSELTSSAPTELDVEHVENESSRISSKEPQSSESTFGSLNEESKENPLANDEKNDQHDNDVGEEENKVADNNPTKGITTTIEMVSMSEEDSLVIDIEDSDSDTTPAKIPQTPPASSPSTIDETETRAEEMSTMDLTQNPVINEGSASTPKPREAEENVNDPGEEPCPKKAKFEYIRCLPSKRIKLPKMPVSEESSSESLPNVYSDDESSSTSSSTICQGIQSMCDVRLKGQSYSLEEDKAITTYICKYNRHTEVKGSQLWKEMEERKICPNRSWQSMKERFKKNISKKLLFYMQAGHLKQADLNLLQHYGFNPESKMNENDKNPSKSGYTLREDNEIIKFIVENSDRGKINGTKLWIMLSKHFEKDLKRDRTWQSLKERFKKRIMPSIWTYDIEKYNYEQIKIIIQECSNSLWNVEELKKNVAAKFQKN